MKKFSMLLAIAMLLCLGACGTGIESPTETQTTSEKTTTTEATATIVATAFPEMTSDEILEEIFQPAIEMYTYLETGGFSNDWEDRFEYYDEENNRHIYTRVTDPRFPSIVAVEAAAREIFSEELAQRFLSLTSLIEKDGKLYTADRSRGGYLTLESIRIESQSKNKIIYRLYAVSWPDEPDEPVINEEYSYTRELINGNWVFTVFPTEWI